MPNKQSTMASRIKFGRDRFPVSSVSNQDFESSLRNRSYQRVLRTVKERFLSSLTKDELEHCGRIALWLALRDHDSAHPSGQKFTTTLFRFMKWECQRLIRRHKREKRCFYIDGDKVPTQKPSRNLDIHANLSLLSEELKDLIIGYYFQKKTLRELALETGYSTEGCRKKLKKAIKNLKILYGVIS